MGITNNNSIKGLSGKVGTFVGSKWKGRQVLKSTPAIKRNQKFTPAQLDQQARFATAIEHVQPMSDFLSRTFPQVKGNKTAYNEAMANAVNNAITGVYPAYSLDWSKLWISRGKLIPADTSTAAVNGTSIQFTWSPEVFNSTDGRDKVILVVYCPELHMAFFDLSTFSRAEGTGQLRVNYFAGRVVQTYIGFITVKGNKASDSKYLGEFTIPAS